MTTLHPIPPPQARPQLRRALLAAADATILRLCKDALTELGFAVTNGLDSGAGAVAAARREAPAVILLSAQLSDVPAREAVTWLRSNAGLSTTPIIILGGRSESDASGYGKGITVLPRPVNIAGLKKSITDALQSAQRRS